MIGTKEYQKRFGADTKADPKNAKAKHSLRVAATMTRLEAELLREQMNGLISRLQLNLI